MLEKSKFRFENKIRRTQHVRKVFLFLKTPKSQTQKRGTFLVKKSNKNPKNKHFFGITHVIELTLKGVNL